MTFILSYEKWVMVEDLHRFPPHSVVPIFPSFCCCYRWVASPLLPQSLGPLALVKISPPKFSLLFSAHWIFFLIGSLGKIHALHNFLQLQNALLILPPSVDTACSISVLAYLNTTWKKKCFYSLSQSLSFCTFYNNCITSGIFLSFWFGIFIRNSVIILHRR